MHSRSHTSHSFYKYAQTSRGVTYVLGDGYVHKPSLCCSESECISTLNVLVAISNLLQRESTKGKGRSLILY